MPNHLHTQTSPYLLQHADNPVDWYPWCDEAFQRAAREDKPIFLSIGYSTCHWCHVMAHESFEDEEIADLLNRHFISIKVDKEERPDLDSIYMAVCQAFTGSGGWPTTLFLTPEQKPFFAGTYFPKHTRGRMVGLRELLRIVHEKWHSDRDTLLRQADQVVAHLNQSGQQTGTADEGLLARGAQQFRQLYDRANGGFGHAPKFPTPHNLLFLLSYAQRLGERDYQGMAEHTLLQMYRGGLFDHIGYGFCRYSTDERFLVPHFEKMLYDNALLILAYSAAYAHTRQSLYLQVAKKTASYVLREMTHPQGGFYSAQDADSDGEEGKYYLFTPLEILHLLGDIQGSAFNQRFDITPSGCFEGKSIPNLLRSAPEDSALDDVLPRLRQYRRQRCQLHLDDKILTFWNSLMIAALCRLYLVSKEEVYLTAARKADEFLRAHLCEHDSLFVSFRAGQRGSGGFLEDYAGFVFAQLALYRATLDEDCLLRAQTFCQAAEDRFLDEQGGYFLYAGDSEQLILRPKETYDGATPSGNALMAWNLVHLSLLTGEAPWRRRAQRQLDFLSAAAQHPSGHAMFLLALLDHCHPPAKVTVVSAGDAGRGRLALSLPSGMVVRLLPQPTEEYPLKNGRDTFYLCRGHSCRPPVNDLAELE